MQRKTRGPRSRSGCITCKIRHVKCGEEKPACLQCERSGRKCDGYDNASQSQLRQRRTGLQLPTPRSTVGADHRIVLRPETRTERRYVDYFFHNTSHALAGFFDSKLWSYLVPQLSEREPSIRHAMAAIGAVHWSKQIPANEQESFDPAQTDLFVLQEYNKAIRHLIEDLSKSQTDRWDLILTTCCLFICLEMLKKNKLQALDHIAAGLRILQGRQQAGQGNSRDNELYEELLDLFTRLNLQASVFGRVFLPLEFPTWEATKQDAPFHSVSQARIRLHRVMSKAMLFIRLTGFERKVREAQVHEKLEAIQTRLRGALEAWRVSLDKTVQKLGTYIQATELRASFLLRIYYHISMIWVLTVLGKDETLFDLHNTDFEMIVRYSEEVIRLNSALKDQQSGFTFEGEIIGPLYFTATKCRNPRTRRKALDVLSGYSREEGMWTTRRYLAVARCIIEVEEGQCPGPVESETDIEDRWRVYESLQPENQDVNPCQVQLISKPDGVEGEWQTQTYLVDWAGFDMMEE